jgi:hypothetical protein
MKYDIATYPASYQYDFGGLIGTFEAMSIGDEDLNQIAIVPMDNPDYEKHLKLISAAPDLLEALQYLIDINTPGRIDGLIDHHMTLLLNRARKAIAKALGEQE